MSLFESASLVVTPNGTKASKLYAIKPTDGSGDLTVTRATTATRVNSSGLISSVASNVPRLDYSNGTCPSILVEPQRTNLLTWSEDFSNTVYSKENSSIVVNSIISLDGTLNADKLVENTNNSTHLFYRTITQGTSGNYTISFFVKANGRTKFEISEGFSIGGNIQFDLVAKTATTNSPAINGFIKEYSNGWFRVGGTWNLTGGSNTIIYLVLKDNAGNFSYTGDGTSGLFIWGAQLEAGSYATSYIPTTSASVTRNTDVIFKNSISSLIGQTEGTVFFDGFFGDTPNQVFLYLQQTGSTGVDNSMYLQKESSSNLIYWNVWNGATQEVFIGGGTLFTSGQRIKIAAVYKLNDFVMYINGVQVGLADTSGIPPTTGNLTLCAYGGDTTLVNFIANRGCKMVALWKTRLTNTQLAELTTI